jgi:hypothetical protein
MMPKRTVIAPTVSSTTLARFVVARKTGSVVCGGSDIMAGARIKETKRVLPNQKIPPRTCSH